MKILTKIILLVIGLSLIPLTTLSLLSFDFFKSMENVAMEKVRDIQKFAVNDSLNSLNELGATVIKNQALATKALVELYLKTHPEKTASDLIGDKEFQKIAIQPVGKTGYTVVIQTKTQNIIAHPNKSMMGTNLLENLRNNEKMQDWWRVVEPTWKNNVDSYGFYQWPEADGTYSDKFMYLAVIDTPLRGNDLSVAATTYIDEFNTPAKRLDEELNKSRDNIVSEIRNTNKRIQQTTIIMILVLFAAVIILSMLFSNRITKPIKKLKHVADKIAGGDLLIKTEIKSNDEIGDLGNSFNTMVDALKKSSESLAGYSRDLEEKVRERTRELEKSKKELETINADLKNFNNMATGRELKMIELKNKIKELKEKLKNNYK